MRALPETRPDIVTSAIMSARPTLRLGFSPCPNDTFMFHGIISGRTPIDGWRVAEELHDVETLNRKAMDGQLDVTKLSFFAWLTLKDRYRLLNAGAALGYGCGPVLVTLAPISPCELRRSRVVLPGEWTTAHLLFRLWAPDAHDRIFTTYDRILDTIRSGRADAGVIIHESRFTYEKEGFQAIVDLGEWWEEETGLPIPLGCIAASRTLTQETVTAIETSLRASIRSAMATPDRSLSYIRRHAREIAADVLDHHIHTFVNDFSLDLGPDGHAAVSALEERAAGAGIIQ